MTVSTNNGLVNGPVRNLLMQFFTLPGAGTAQGKHGEGLSEAWGVHLQWQGQSVNRVVGDAIPLSLPPSLRRCRGRGRG